MNRKRINALIILTLLLIACVASPIADAASIQAILHTNETKVTSSNTLGVDADGLLYTCGVLSSSVYQVRANYGEKGHERTKGSVDPGHTKTWTIEYREYQHETARVIMYGYSQAEPRKKCYAAGVLANR